MARTLIIKDADFSTNKIETVAFDAVPCTGISLNKATSAITKVGSTDTLTATLTPENTTDTLSWASSNSNVVTVSNGVITATGVGSATITATCGEQTATCTVTVTHVINANTELEYRNGYYQNYSLDPSTTPPKDLVSIGALDRNRVYFDGTNELSGYKAFSNYNNFADFISTAFPIPVPNGATNIKVQFPTGFNTCPSGVLDSQTGCEYYASYSATQGAKLIAKGPSGYFNDGVMNFDLTNITGYDSFVFSLGTPSGSTAESVTGDVTITFS